MQFVSVTTKPPETSVATCARLQESERDTRHRLADEHMRLSGGFLVFALSAATGEAISSSGLGSLLHAARAAAAEIEIPAGGLYGRRAVPQEKNRSSVKVHANASEHKMRPPQTLLAPKFDPPAAPRMRQCTALRLQQTPTLWAG